MDVFFVHLRKPVSSETSFENFCTLLDVTMPIPLSVEEDGDEKGRFLLCVSNSNMIQCKRIAIDCGYKILCYYSKKVDTSQYNNHYYVTWGWGGNHTLIRRHIFPINHDKIINP